eukprot:SAG31_NODE_586_length_13839_cov_22.698544_4_plen_109_part_00
MCGEARCRRVIESVKAGLRLRIYLCKNDAECHDDPYSELGYSCTCRPGWSGDNCDEDVDECASVVGTEAQRIEVVRLDPRFVEGAIVCLASTNASLLFSHPSNPFVHE